MNNTKTIIGLISIINEKSSQYINEELRRKEIKNIINSHGTIFSLLYGSKGRITINEIVSKTGKRKSTITDMVKKLEKLGYISKEKNKDDARIIEITLTESGWKFKESFKEISNNLLDKTYFDFTEEEKELLVTLLRKVRKNFLTEENKN
ncbi:MarR family winged helix-turn-helix transcriptional regulator [Fusobacterium sp. IOR10]|uniref:MarR family winged helix-turn-helix transcriptional regulator n=1 Tax=Fusobacterium sp. IOR10 TaxID=2665157 RepID=UPI0013D8647A|nr:MarR family transcriptional regulator [Fusobacterium sp. IOR10]